MSLLEKLAKIQALVERTSSEGERQAATLAMERLLKRQEQLPVEIRLQLQPSGKKNFSWHCATSIN